MLFPAFGFNLLKADLENVGSLETAVIAGPLAEFVAVALGPLFTGQLLCGFGVVSLIEQSLIHLDLALAGVHSDRVS